MALLLTETGRFGGVGVRSGAQSGQVKSEMSVRRQHPKSFQMDI